MDKPLLRWGILGTASIARKNWKAIWNSGNGRITAVASRELQRSERFIAECQAEAPFAEAPRAFGSYEQLLSAQDVDAVYIPLPTGIRAQWVKRAAEAGKHVICEKPCATSVAELTEMLEVCRRNQVQFLDGVMFVHSRRMERVRAALDDGQTVGPVKRISSAFSFIAPEEFFASNIRSQSELEPDGCLGDLGWYCIRFALWTMKWQLPQRATGQLLAAFRHRDSKAPVPTEFSGELFFEDGVSSSFYCSFITQIEQWTNVSGTRGHVWLRDFVLPFAGSQTVFETENPVFEVHGCDFAMHPHRGRRVAREPSHGSKDAQESRLFRHFAEQVQSGTLNPRWPEIALKTQQVLEACRNSSRADGRPTKLDQLNASAS